MAMITRYLQPLVFLLRRLRKLLYFLFIASLTCFLLILDWSFKLPSTYQYETKMTSNMTETAWPATSSKSMREIPTFCKNDGRCRLPSAAALAFSKWVKENHSTHLVNTTGCKILEMDPFDPPILEFMTEGTIIKCPPSVAKQDFQTRKLSLDPEFLKSWTVGWGGGGYALLLLPHNSSRPARSEQARQRRRLDSGTF